MTKTRLLEAIALHDPDGGALARVLAAARANALAQCGGIGCPLAVAWSSLTHVACVGTHQFFRCYLRDTGKVTPTTPHGCTDVVSWFDDGVMTDFHSRAANQKVLSLLETTDDD